MSTEPHLTSEDLDLLRLGALSGERATRVQAHLEGCAACRDQQQEDATTAARFEQFVLPRTVSAVQARGRRSLLPRLVRVLVPLAALATVVTVVGVRTAGPAEEDYLGIRGGAGWTVVAARGEAQRTLGSGDAVQEGDRLRFVVDPGTATHLLIVSLDGAGVISVYFPPGAEQSGPLGPGRQELPGSIQLDATLGQEQVWAVFSRQPLRAQTVREAVRAGTVERLDGAEEVLTLRLQKEAR